MEENILYNTVKEFIHSRQLVSAGDRILLSLSAGKDSMALLDIFSLLKEELLFDFGIFHLNHMMRGSESLEDEEFLTGLASEKGIKIHLEKYNFKENIPGGTCFEDFARTKRYEFIEEICIRENYNKAATAHNLDDNVETIMMRILEGTGLYGLKGIDPCRGRIIRPLLCVSAPEVYGYLRIRNISWREDSSNKNNEYTRNYLRNIILPGIAERFADYKKAVLSLSSIASEHIDIIDCLIEKEYSDSYRTTDQGFIISLEKLVNNEPLLRYLLVKALRWSDLHYISGRIIKEIFKNLKVNRSNIILYQNGNLTVRKALYENSESIIVSNNYKNHTTFPEWEYRLDISSDSEKKLYIKEIKKEIFVDFISYEHFMKNFREKNKIFVKIDGNVDYIIIRNRRDGDRINLPFGRKKIKDIMIENKLEKNIKEKIPLTIIHEQIAAYMPGLVTDLQNRISSDFRVAEDTKKILAICAI